MSRERGSFRRGRGKGQGFSRLRLGKTPGYIQKKHPGTFIKNTGVLLVKTPGCFCKKVGGVFAKCWGVLLINVPGCFNKCACVLDLNMV